MTSLLDSVLAWPRLAVPPILNYRCAPLFRVFWCHWTILGASGDAGETSKLLQLPIPRS